MADFTIKSDNVDVEQIMRQIRTRIKEKRGVDYTEEEVRELANVKLEKFLNPRAVRSELVEQYRRQRQSIPAPTLPPHPENFEFEGDTIYASHRSSVLPWLRKLLNPVLKLLFNPNPVIQALHRQSRVNSHVFQGMDLFSQRFVTRDELDALNFEVLNNMVLELTRLSIEVKNLKMRIESMSARQEFNERKTRTVEGLIATPAAPAGGKGGAREGAASEGEEGEGRTRRRRRRRGRRRPEGEAQQGQGREGLAGPGEERTRADSSEHSVPESGPPPSSEPGTEQ